MSVIRKGNFVLAGLVLALGLSACDNSAANKKANEEAAARAAAAAKVQKLHEAAQYNIGCLAALRWQAARLKTTAAGDAAPYADYYRGKLEAALGDQTLPAADGAPALSKASIDAYLDWAYPRMVETRFRIGRDANGDGTLAPEERAAPGINTVAQCVQFAAEMGTGPLAGSDKVGRVGRIDGIRRALRDKPA